MDNVVDTDAQLPAADGDHTSVVVVSPAVVYLGTMSPDVF
jgi:hypothetical protein